MEDGKTTRKKGLPDYYLVTQAQRKLYLDGKYPDLMNYISRPAFRDIAYDLVSYYFPHSVAKRLSIVAELVDHYRFWLALAPSSFKLLGYWRPGWRASVFNSWTREHTYKYKRFHLGRVPLDFSFADLRDGAEDAMITDQIFLLRATDILPQAIGDTARAELVRMIFAPLAFRLDGKAALAEARAHKCGLLWYENEILFLSRKPFAYPGIIWTDLSQESADVLHWRISFQYGDLNARIAPRVIKEIKSEVRNIFDSDSTPEWKLARINKQTQKFYNLAKYSFNAMEQGSQLDSWLWKLVGKRIVSTNPKLKERYFNLKKQRWQAKFRKPARDTLLLNDMPYDQWRQIWNPRR